MSPSMQEHKGAPVAEDDAHRVSVLRSLNILDTAPEECFDRIAASAIECFKVLLKCLPHACAVDPRPRVCHPPPLKTLP